MKLKQLACSVLAATMAAGAAHAAKTTINGGGSSLAAPTYFLEFSKYTKATPSILFSYEAVGSGGGQTAFLNNDITQFQNVPAGTLTYGTIVGTTVDFGASDAYLVASQLTNPATGSYGLSAQDGPVIQFPTFGTPITMAYNESQQSGTLTLTDNQVCGILSGQITDWNTINPSIPAGTTINVVVRADGSGTTFLLTQHLNVACNAGNSSFPSYPVPVTKYFYNSSTKASNYIFNTLPGNFTGESGSANVAAQELATSDSFGYLSPDYTSIAPNSANTNSLAVASLVNATNGVAYSPTVANTETGLAHPGNGSVNFAPPASKTEAMNPLNWVPQIPQTKTGYPIVGYTTMLLSSCYASTTAGTALKTLFTDENTSAGYKALVMQDGFVPLANTAASPFVTAVDNTLLGNKSGYNLNVDNATTCASYAGR
jgi:phosphate transport system substrate-binding protein